MHTISIFRSILWLTVPREEDSIQEKTVSKLSGSGTGVGLGGGGGERAEGASPRACLQANSRIKMAKI